MQQRPSAATLQFKVLTSSSNRIYNTLQQQSRNYSLKIQSQSRLLSKKKVNELNGIRKSKKTCTLRAQEVAEISCSSSFSAKSCSACYASCCIRSNATAAAASACCFASHSAASLPAVEADESSQ